MRLPGGRRNNDQDAAAEEMNEAARTRALDIMQKLGMQLK